MTGKSVAAIGFAIVSLTSLGRSWGGEPAGQALQFEDDALRIPANTFDGLGDFTFEIWTKITAIDPDALTVTNTFLSLANDVTDNVVTWGQNPNGQVRIFLDGMPNGRNLGPPLCLDTWYHVAVTRQATAVNVYVNAELAGMVGGPIDALLMGQSGAWMGQEQDCLANCFDSAQAHSGILDEVRVWDLPRTQEQLRDTMHRSLNGDESGLIGYWRLDDGVGQFAVDSSPSGFDGILGENPMGGGDALDPVWIASDAPLVEGNIFSVAIVGLSEVAENWQAAFSAFATHGEGPAIDETYLSLVGDWSIDPAEHGAFTAPGQLTTFEIGDADVTAVLTGGIENHEELISGELAVTLVATGGAERGLLFADDAVALDAAAFDGLTDFTFEMWVSFDDVPGTDETHTLLSLANSLTDDFLTLRQFEDGRLRIFVKGMTDGVNFGPVLSSDAWHHVAVVRQDIQFQVYVDGVVAVAFCRDAGPLDVDENGAWLAQEQDCVGGCFDPLQAHAGRMDEVRLWSVARAESEVHAALFHRLSGDESGLVGYWRLDEGEGQTLNDSSMSGHDASLGIDPANSDEFDPMWLDSDAPIAPQRLRCQGDANLDKVVDPLDAGFVSARFGCSVGVGDEDCDAADQTGDGLVDPLDVGYVLARFGDCP